MTPTEARLKKYGLFAAPLNNGDWMVGKANLIYHMDITSNHYIDPDLSVASTLSEAIQKWIELNA